MSMLASALGKGVDIKALAGQLANRSDEEVADLAKRFGIKDPAGLAAQFSGAPKDEDEESLVNTLKKAMPSLAPSTSAAPEGTAVTSEQSEVVIKLAKVGFPPKRALDIVTGRPATATSPEVPPATSEQLEVTINLATAGLAPETALDLAIGRPTKGGKRRKTFRKRKHAKKTKKVISAK